MSPAKDSLQHEFDDHPSIAASLEDFESSEPRHSPILDIPSHHSGFKAADLESEPGSSDSAGPWSPPAWHRPATGWFNNDILIANAATAYRSPTRSRESSPEHDDEPTKIPLPYSPEKGRSISPSPQPSSNQALPRKVSSIDMSEKDEHPAPTLENYIRFSVRADVQHRTEIVETFLSLCRRTMQRITKSYSSIFMTILMAIFAWNITSTLVRPPESGPGPDLVKVAGLAKSFEPLIHYSENGVQQIGDLQETGVAVWDLGESVRSSNMTSAPIIVRELDDLSDSLKTLAIELTKFFANVDGDVDSILIVIDWAKRELSQVAIPLPNGLTSLVENTSILAQKYAGPLLSSYMNSAFGLSHTARTRATLQRTFHEFLNVLEDSINSELRYSTALFGLFESIDRQFLNLQRTVIRETDSQEAARDAELGTLWSKLIGNNKARLVKFDKNKDLLRSVRTRTVQNKLTLADHNGRLLALKASLEMLRQRLVSPLVRSENASTLSIGEQIQGLDLTYEYLKGVREDQKEKMMKRLYGGERTRSKFLDGK